MVNRDLKGMSLMDVQEWVLARGELEYEHLDTMKKIVYSALGIKDKNKVTSFEQVKAMLS